MGRDEIDEALQGFSGLGLNDTGRLAGARLAEIENTFVGTGRQVFCETSDQAIEGLGLAVIIQGQRDALHEKPPEAPSPFPSRLSLRLLQDLSKSGAIILSKILTDRPELMIHTASTGRTDGDKPLFNRS